MNSLRTKRQHKLLFLLCCAVLLFSCNNIQQEKFDKVNWYRPADPAFPPSHRKNMLKDLTTNYKLTGIKYSELINLLGEPNFIDSSSFGYEVDVDYGHDIDPIYIKN